MPISIVVRRSDISAFWRVISAALIHKGRKGGEIILTWAIVATTVAHQAGSMMLSPISVSYLAKGIAQRPIS
jgi:predicted N-acetyltransferase YhbS